MALQIRATSAACASRVPRSGRVVCQAFNKGQFAASLAASLLIVSPVWAIDLSPMASTESMSYEQEMKELIQKRTGNSLPEVNEVSNAAAVENARIAAYQAEVSAELESFKEQALRESASATAVQTTSASAKRAPKAAESDASSGPSPIVIAVGALAIVSVFAAVSSSTSGPAETPAAPPPPPPSPTPGPDAGSPPSV